MLEYPETYRHPLPNGLYYDVVRIDPALFIMGSNADAAYEDEKEHWVRLTQHYYIGVYPVTQAIWKSLMDGE